jgi:hypothetical protein
MDLQDRIGEILPARPRDLSDVIVLVWHRPSRTKDHAADRNGAMLPLLVYG